jgi:hypothetical protein
VLWKVPVLVVDEGLGYFIEEGFLFDFNSHYSQSGRELETQLIKKKEIFVVDPIYELKVRVRVTPYLFRWFYRSLKITLMNYAIIITTIHYYYFYYYYCEYRRTKSSSSRENARFPARLTRQRFKNSRRKKREKKRPSKVERHARDNNSNNN